MSRRSPRRADDRGALAIACWLTTALAGSAGGCITSLGEVGGAGERADSSSTSGATPSDPTTSATSRASGAASDDGEVEAGTAPSDERGDTPTFDLGHGPGSRDGGSSESSSGAPPRDPDPPPPYDGDCCVPAEDGAGCGDAVVQDCVCADDPYCCATAWDELCVAEVTNLGCGACGNGVRPAGFDVQDGCCAPHEESGCNDAAIADCVCAIDPYCCMIAWDQVCVDQVESFGCSDCGGGTSDGGSSSSSGTD